MKDGIKRTLAVFLILCICFRAINVDVFAKEPLIGEQETVITESVYEAAYYKVIFSLNGYWDGGYNANIKIVNTGDKTIENWILGCDYNGAISNIWNAVIDSCEENKYIIKNAGWNQDIPVGGSVEFGFFVNENFQGFPKECKILGERIEKSTEDYSITYCIADDWGNGFSASISITNNTDTSIEDWTLAFDFDRTITTMWDGVIESHQENHYVINNASYNSNIAAGQTVSFGFNGCGGNKSIEPENYILSDVFATDSEDNGTGIDLENDSDKDGVSDYVENLFGTDPFLEDTDADGLSDYIEVYLIETNPLKQDSDGNGVLDGDEDFDLDGFTNLEEINLGTNITKGDSDNDGLTDYEEVNNFGTNPIEPDTDGDGISDGNEILLGLDPLNPISDGVISDAERIFYQELNVSNIEETLLEDNLVIPSIKGEVADNINCHVALDEEDVYALNDNRAVLGKQVQVSTDYNEDDDLKLYFDCTSAEKNLDLLMICSYEDGEINPCDTFKDENAIWTNVSSGIYFVINVEILLYDLDIPVDKYISLSPVLATASLSQTEEEKVVIPESAANEVELNWFKENYTLIDREGKSTENDVLIGQEGVTVNEIIDATNTAEEQYVLTSSLYQPMILANTVGNTVSNKISGQADIVFVIDSTGSMSSAINNVVKNIDTFVDTLATNYSVKANFALIEYKDITYGEKTLLTKNGYSNWFNDVTSFKKHVNNILVNGGGDGPETPIDGLAMAHSLDFRHNANKFVILITDANYKTNNTYGIGSMAEMANMLADADIVTSVISNTSYQSLYSNLYTKTNGVFGNINGDFSSVLLKLAENIGEIVNDGSWVILSDYQYVRLDRPLSSDGYSSDSDSLSDKEELGEAEERDLTRYIYAFLKAYSIPEALYEDQTSITVYKYISNPVLSDTDFDGINDDKDSAKKDNNFKGRMHYKDNKKYKTCDVEFSVDYRDFFEDNTIYNNDLAVLSVLYASDIYVDTYIQVTNGTRGGSDNATSFGTLFGLADVENIFIKGENYTSDKDDVTDFVIGHRNVEYRGETREIIILTIRGTNGTNSEWSSNFDVGADTKEYYNAIGSDHPYWKNKINHKGFDVTANRVLEKVEDYIRRHGLNDDSINKSILITGHSRGAGISNLLGAHFENDSNYKSYTYTFASPYTTTDSNAGNYATIMNVMNEDDLIPYLPLAEWGFKKYGKMYTISVEDAYENKWKAAKEGTFEWLMGFDYNNDGGTSRTLNCFLEIASCRDDLYKLDSSSDGKVNIGNKYHTTTEGANKRCEEVKKSLEEVKLLRFCNVYVTGSPVKHVEVNYCPAYLMQNLANMASSTGPIIGYDVNGKYAMAKASFIASSGQIPGQLVGGMAHPHMQPTYYLIVHNKVKPL